MASDLKVQRYPTLVPVKYLVPFLVTLLALDSALKELPGVPAYLRNGGFYALPPLLVGGSLLLIPYTRSRLAIVSPSVVTRVLLIAMIGISIFAAFMLGIMYYQQEPFDGADGGAINSTALFAKDVILVASIGAFSLRGFRLLQWHARIRNFVVLAFALSSFGLVSFAAFHIIKDYSGEPVPDFVLNGTATSFIAFVLLTHASLILMLRAYFGGFGWIKFVAVVLSAPALFVPNLILMGYPQLQLHVNTVLSTTLDIGFIIGGPVLLWAWYLLAPLFTNPVARGYFETFAYSYGLFAGATCGMGLMLGHVFPLPGYASLFAFFGSATLSFAAFTSLASYFSITEDLRRQIRESTGFFTAIGEAESGIAMERQLTGFYNRFSELARASGALEASAFTKEEMKSYIASLKKVNQR